MRPYDRAAGLGFRLEGLGFRVWVESLTGV